MALHRKSKHLESGRDSAILTFALNLMIQIARSVDSSGVTCTWISFSTTCSCPFFKVWNLCLLLLLGRVVLALPPRTLSADLAVGVMEVTASLSFSIAVASFCTLIGSSSEGTSGSQRSTDVFSRMAPVGSGGSL